MRAPRGTRFSAWICPPYATTTAVELSSTWPDPSFGGAFLPDARTVGANGFNARWTISSLARSYPQKWRDSAADSIASVGAYRRSHIRAPSPPAQDDSEDEIVVNDPG